MLRVRAPLMVENCPWPNPVKSPISPALGQRYKFRLELLRLIAKRSVLGETGVPTGISKRSVPDTLAVTRHHRYCVNLISSVIGFWRPDFLITVPEHSY